MPRHSWRKLFFLPFIGSALYVYSEEQKFVFNERLRERDDTLRANAMSILGETNIEVEGLIDLMNDGQPIDSEFFHDQFTIVFSGDILSFKEIQDTIEDKLQKYNIHYLFLVSAEYSRTSEKLLQAFHQLNPKKDNLIIALDTSTSIIPKTIYCILNDKLVYMHEFTYASLPQFTKTLAIKINKNLEKLFVKQIDF